MVVPSHQVVSPPKHQGSVLARIVAGDSVLGQLLYWIAFSLALKRSISDTQAELAALRAVKTFAFKVGRDNGYRMLLQAGKGRVPQRPFAIASQRSG